MDILTFFDILLKPPQPFTGLFFSFPEMCKGIKNSIYLHFNSISLENKDHSLSVRAYITNEHV